MGLFKKIFGASQAEVWEQVAKSVEGEFIKGSFTKPHMLVVQHHNWEIVLDTYSKENQTYTRIRVPFVNTSKVHFKLYRENFFSTIGKSLGMQDITIGNKKFDDDFVIKGNNEKLITALFSNEEVRHLISLQSKYFLLEIKDDEGWFGKDFPKDVDQICFEESMILKDPIALERLVKLLIALLDQLIEINAISPKNAGISLHK